MKVWGVTVYYIVLKYLLTRCLSLRKGIMITFQWKSVRHHLNHITIYGTCWHHVPAEMKPLRKTQHHFCAATAKSAYLESNNKETTEKPKLRGSLLNSLYSSKTAMAWNTKKRLKYSSRLKEIKETQQLNSRHDLGLSFALHYWGNCQNLNKFWIGLN